MQRFTHTHTHTHTHNTHTHTHTHTHSGINVLVLIDGLSYEEQGSIGHIFNTLQARRFPGFTGCPLNALGAYIVCPNFHMYTFHSIIE